MDSAEAANLCAFRWARTCDTSLSFLSDKAALFLLSAIAKNSARLVSLQNTILNGHDSAFLMPWTPKRYDQLKVRPVNPIRTIRTPQPPTQSETSCNLKNTLVTESGSSNIDTAIPIAPKIAQKRKKNPEAMAIEIDCIRLRSIIHLTMAVGVCQCHNCHHFNECACKL